MVAIPFIGIICFFPTANEVSKARNSRAEDPLASLILKGRLTILSGQGAEELSGRALLKKIKSAHLRPLENQNASEQRQAKVALTPLTPQIHDCIFLE